MRRLLSTFVIVFLFFIFFMELGLSSPIKINVESAIFTAYIGEELDVDVSIINDQNFTDSFSLSIWPPIYTDLEEYYITIPPLSSKNVRLSIIPPITATVETKQYIISAVSNTDPNVSVSKNLYVDVRMRSGLYISSLSLDKEIINPTEEIKVSTTITNLDSFPHENILVETVLSKEDRVFDRSVDKIRIISRNSAETILTVFKTTKYMEGGKYTITSTLKDNLNRIIDVEKKDINITSEYNIIKTKSIKYGLLYHSVAITLLNDGNENAKNVSITESVPALINNFFYPEIEPSEIQRVGNRIVYKWDIGIIKPGKTVVIKYQLRFVNVILISIIIIGLIVLGMKYRMVPRVEKMHKFKKVEGKKEIRVFLSVKNNSTRTINNVIVRDIVPPLASIIKEFETLEPEIKGVKSGTMLVWKLGSLKPKEERLLTYKIRPLIEVIGKFRLSKAIMTYEIKGKKEKTHSNAIDIITSFKEKS